jgi:hypothetical protein
VQKYDRRTVRRAGLGVADVEQAGVDPLQRRERRVRSRLDRGQRRRICLTGLRGRRAAHSKLCGGDRHDRGAKEAAATMVDFVGDLGRIHK